MVGTPWNWVCSSASGFGGSNYLELNGRSNSNGIASLSFKRKSPFPKLQYHLESNLKLNMTERVTVSLTEYVAPSPIPDQSRGRCTNSLEPSATRGGGKSDTERPYPVYLESHALTKGRQVYVIDISTEFPCLHTWRPLWSLSGLVSLISAKLPNWSFHLELGGFSGSPRQPLLLSSHPHHRG